ncbi:MAG: rhomboid family intramembrane serine protease [Dysgonamonadaceae bacterium]|jgi:membrane associated rhomboid family serine protease|nr:rhomboid family intramembrane serine protease [Dysgonamonadaceae bacterium]
MTYFNNNNFLNSIPVVTRNLLIINVIVWLACFLFEMININLSGILGLHYFQAKRFYIYQLITYMFTHVEFSHLFFNMFALFMFGGLIERTWGPKRYLIYYMVTGVGAGLIQMLVSYLHIRSLISGINLDLLNVSSLYDLYPVTIGASGSVFGLLLAFGMLFPNLPLYIMFIPIPIKAKYLVIGYGVIEFFFGIYNRAGDNVAHFAHLGGMLFGFFMILYWNKGNRINRFFKRKKNKITFIHKRPETDQEYNKRKSDQSKEIDRILDKIKKSGYDSLSKDEKKTLFDANK